MFKGHCNCSSLQFELKNPPLFTHACHCLDCQRRTGSVFELTCIVIENDIVVKEGDLSTEQISDRSTAYRCVSCSEVVYITSSAFPATARLMPKYLEDLRELEVGAHIWTKRKHHWLVLPEDVPQFDEEYDWEKTWPQASLARLEQRLKGGAT